MNVKKRLKALVLSVLLLFSVCAVPVSAQGVKESDRTDGKEVQILFTHDMHSHLDSYKAVKNGEQVVIGGFAKLKTMVDEKRAGHGATFLVDGGDFSMGTLYQTIYELSLIHI